MRSPISSMRPIISLTATRIVDEMDSTEANYLLRGVPGLEVGCAAHLSLDVAQYLRDRAADIRRVPIHTLGRPWVRQPRETGGANSIAKWLPVLDNDQNMLYTINDGSLLGRAALDIFGRSGFWFGSL